MMKKYYARVNLIQAGVSYLSEHHPYAMGDNFSLEATSPEEAVKKAYEQSSGEAFSEFDPYIKTTEGLYCLINIEITEDCESKEPKFWKADIKNGKIIIKKR